MKIKSNQIVVPKKIVNKFLVAWKKSSLNVGSLNNNFKIDILVLNKLQSDDVCVVKSTTYSRILKFIRLHEGGSDYHVGDKILFFNEDSQKMSGHIIDEFERFYLIQTKHYKTCVYKTDAYKN